VRVVAVHRDALVVTSRLWQTNAVALRAGGESMLVDSPYFPDELDALQALLGQAGFEPAALIATHADFDHVLGRLAFPELALGVGDSTFERLQREPGGPQRVLRDHDAEHYVERERPLSLGQVQRLPVPGKLELGPEELELHPAEGHTPDGAAVFARWTGVLACGDYLSNVEIPMISKGGSLSEYQGTLERFRPLVEAAESIVPGHGAIHGRDAALRILDEDLHYLEGLARGDQRLPGGRDSKAQRAIHARNVERLS
jgi:glyoxylase-like metal-dependent hydrolase (beta-lactamase superfamily II)